ncbi:hypothetical protein [Congregibacter sp.]|uniref:hypothetical protein n=1 Tax=Congregibacter sp. TaxID=2744308 RepID=UPI003F6D4F64
MGIVGVLLAALIIGFLVMTNMSSTGDGVSSEPTSDSEAPMQIDTDKPANAVESLENRANSLLQSSEDKYRDLDQ